jgi:8-amino-7-oxononanoate synthase
MPINPYAWLEESLDTIVKADWYRTVKTIESRPGAVIQLEGRETINFASNDYLGLAGDRRLIGAAIAATKLFGTGTTGSRLLSGHRQIHADLESAIAEFKNTEDALVFSSGYLANLGAIAALVGKRDLILADQYNHSSLKNGAILSGATVVNYTHCDVGDLAEKLGQMRDRYRRCLIITDSIFSMDGDICPLPDLLDLAEKFGCMLLVDEAHATGVEHFGCNGRQLIQMGTLSKALGSLGGFIAGSSILIDFLRNRAPSWIYTTGLSPADTAAGLEAIKIIQKEPKRRAILWRNVFTFKQLIHQKLPGLKLLSASSPIFCWQVADAATALRVGNHLKEAGIFAPAIRPPTVPTSRIRVSIMSTHEIAHLETLVNALLDAGLE